MVLRHQLPPHSAVSINATFLPNSGGQQTLQYTVTPPPPKPREGMAEAEVGADGEPVEEEGSQGVGEEEDALSEEDAASLKASQEPIVVDQEDNEYLFEELGFDSAE